MSFPRRRESLFPWPAQQTEVPACAGLTWRLEEIVPTATSECLLSFRDLFRAALLQCGDACSLKAYLLRSVQIALAEEQVG